MATSAPLSSRKMRRTRDSAGGSENLLSGFALYNVQGDSAAALAAFSSKEDTLASSYNDLLLKLICDGFSAEDFLSKLKEQEALILDKKKDELVSRRKLNRNEFILTFNRALVLQTSGDVHACAKLCCEKLSPMIKSREKPDSELAMVASRMAFLLLDCILTLAVGRNTGLQPNDIPLPDAIMDWISSLNVEKDPQLKFLLPLYKSRWALAELENGKHVDSNIRAARKDMKTAMEVFQHKLRPSFGAESGSVASSANSEENSANTSSEQQPPPPSSVVLQKLNQSALSLKAHLEQLKGNTKKSLILCNEAQTAVVADSASYDALHSNNLAVIYETNNKRHLALHALAKSLRASSDAWSSGLLFHKDGTARPSHTSSIMHNAAICALLARNYLSAYECMAYCISRSIIFRSRPSCWLRMAEACIGVFADLKRENNVKRFSTVEVDGKPEGIVVGNGMFSDDIGFVREKLEAALGSPEDLAQVKRSPLLRARAALEYAMQHGDQLDADVLVSARLSMAYVYLSFKEYRLALDLAKLVLDENSNARGSNNGSASKVILTMRKRQLATARMYAAEASCALGEMAESMKYLVGDGKDDAFDRLASDLGGVTLETAATNPKGKRRLAKAQTTVRSSAAVVTAAMGNPAAKQLANSANAMEDAYSADRERSSARRAMIYTLLREGHQSSALNMLLSLR